MCVSVALSMDWMPGWQMQAFPLDMGLRSGYDLGHNIDVLGGGVSVGGANSMFHQPWWGMGVAWDPDPESRRLVRSAFPREGAGSLSGQTPAPQPPPPPPTVECITSGLQLCSTACLILSSFLNLN